MGDFHGGRLILSRPENGVCSHCGDSYPILAGEKISTCREWVEKTITRLPQPVSFDVFLSLKIFSRLCAITTHIQRGLEVLGEVEGRG